MLPENMPYYRGPRVVPPPSADEQTTDVNHCQSLLTQVLTHSSYGLCHLSVNPVTFGEFDTVTPSNGHASTNHKFPCYAQQVLCFSWAVYSFGGGHLASTIATRSLPFCVKLACDQYDFGRAYSGNSLSALKSSSTARICSITSAHLAIVLKYMAILSILFGFGTATQLCTFGSCRHPLWLSYVPFVPCKSSLQS